MRKPVRLTNCIMLAEVSNPGNYVFTGKKKKKTNSNKTWLISE